MTDEEIESPRPSMRPGPARIEVRVWLDYALHERIVREAAAEGRSVSKAVRDGMREYLALKDGLASVWSEGSAPPDSSRGAESPSPSGPSKNPILRMLQEHAAQDQKLDSLSRQIEVIACMIDQAYQGLVGRLGPVPAEYRAQRGAAAQESAARWRAAVAKLFRERKYRLLADLWRGEDERR